MECFYLKENKKINRLKYLYNKIEKEEDVIFLPVKQNMKVSLKKAKKIVKKLNESNINIVALSEELNNIKTLKNEIYLNNIKILNGKYLFKIVIKEIIEYICKKKNKQMKELELSFLANDYSNLNREIILNIVPEVKRVNIITKNINKFKDIESYLYNEHGIVIKISNNKYKDLLKSNIIINMDFDEDTINNYNIPQKGIVINVANETKIKSKKFNGININNYNIIMPRLYKVKGFEDKIVYESKIFNLEYIKAREQISKDKIKIKDLIGEKSIINEKEFI